MKISKNFTLAEMIKSSTASRNGINNNPRKRELDNIKALVTNVLQPIRDELGLVMVNSGFRSFALEKVIYRMKVARLLQVGGPKAVNDWLSLKSHPKGEAADIEVPGMDNKELWNWISENIPEYDQLILEFYKEGVPDSGWVHVSFSREKNRKMKFTID